MADELNIQTRLQQPALVTKNQQQNPKVGYSAEVVSEQAISQRELSEKGGDEGSSSSILTQGETENLQEKVAQLNDYMQSLNRQLQFKVDDRSGDTVITVIDSETEEVVRQIPSKEVLEIRGAIAEYRGMLVETKA
jgi:flagellar protein FlaG